MNSWITIDITLFTCIKLADLGDPGLYLVVETDGWRLPNDTSKKPFLFNEVYKTQNSHWDFAYFPSRIGTVLEQTSTTTVSAADFPHLTPSWKVAFWLSKWLIPACNQYPHEKTNRQIRISVIETVLGGKISDYSPTLWSHFHVTMLVWCYTILNSMCIVSLPLSNNI